MLGAQRAVGPTGIVELLDCSCCADERVGEPIGSEAGRSRQICTAGILGHQIGSVVGLAQCDQARDGHPLEVAEQFGLATELGAETAGAALDDEADVVDDQAVHAHPVGPWGRGSRVDHLFRRAWETTRIRSWSG